MRWAREHDFDDAINLASARWNVPVPLIKAVIAVESQFNPLAINYGDPGYAWGLMQMIPATAAGLGYTGSMNALRTDPSKAIDLGTHLLSQGLARTGGVVADTASAYNGGYRPALGFGSVLPSGVYGNQSYVNQVLDALAYFQGTPAGGGAVPSGAASFHPGRRPGMDAPRPVPAKIETKKERP
jgi:soluble lytic murein transglycosylase-like protein